MDLLNMTFRANIHEFSKKVRGNFYLSRQKFKILGLISIVMIKYEISAQYL